jgi:hypothetical protein
MRKHLERIWVLDRYKRAQIHRLENGAYQVITPVGDGLYEALGRPATYSRDAWTIAWRNIQEADAIGYTMAEVSHE